MKLQVGKFYERPTEKGGDYIVFIFHKDNENTYYGVPVTRDFGHFFQLNGQFKFNESGKPLNLGQAYQEGLIREVTNPYGD